MKILHALTALAVAAPVAAPVAGQVAAGTALAVPGAALAAPASDCEPLTGPSVPAPGETTVATIKQAYDCILSHYFSGPVMDDRALLAAAFAGYTQELQRTGRDTASATMPALTGDRTKDWEAISTALQSATEGQAKSAIVAMVAGLHDNHAHWDKPVIQPKPMKGYGTGITGLSAHPLDPAATAPLFVTAVVPGSPADKQGIKRGDVIRAVGDVPPLADGVLSERTRRKILSDHPGTDPVRLRLTRPHRTWTATVKPGPFEITPPKVTAKLLPGKIAYARIPEFYPEMADQALAAIAKLGKATGLVLDLRGNHGGSPREVTRLLGAFAHGKVTGYFCDVRDKCAANRTDDSVKLLGVPLVLLTDRGCASACDDFSAAVKDLRLGQLVGTRTAGVVSGPASGYLLDDGSILNIPRQHHRGANKELVDTIGVAPDHNVPTTAADLSTGGDPALAKARRLLSNA